MNKINYDEQMNKIINNISGEKKRLLIHCCCAPCASSSLERILNYFDITAYFYNPNIDTLKEYEFRANELKRLCEIYNVNYIIEDYNKDDFLRESKGLEQEKERGLRCEKCFNLRLSKTALKAKENAFEYFATTLTLSPLKDSDLLNKIGFLAGEKVGVNYLPTDFKKQGGNLRSITLCKEYNLYRQSYCGCEFSKNK